MTASNYSGDLTAWLGKRKMRPIEEIMLLCLVLGSFSVTSILVPSKFGYLMVAGVFSLGCIWHLLTNQSKFVGTKSVLAIYVVVICLFLPGTIQNSSIGGIARLAAFTTVTTMIIFSFVCGVNFARFWRWYGSITAIIVLLGVPTLIVDQYSLFSVTITAYGTAPTAPIDIGVNTITSIFTNPNNLALVCCFAVVGIVTTQRFSIATFILVAINAVGVFAADGQAAQLAVIAGLGIFTIGSVNRSVIPLLSILALAVIATGLLMIFQIIPGPDTLSTLSLSGRRHLWAASIQALEARALIGYGTVDMSTVLEPYITDPQRLGVGPHNSFIRVTLSGGVLGGVAYLSLHLYGLVQSGRLSTKSALSSNAMLWTTCILQLFNGNTLFGLSASSILFAISLGWTVRELSEKP